MTLVVLCTVGAALGAVGVISGARRSSRLEAARPAVDGGRGPTGLWSPWGRRWVPERWVSSSAEHLAERPAVVSWLQPMLLLTETSWAQFVDRVAAAAVAGLAMGFALAALQTVTAGQFSVLPALVVVVLGPLCGVGLVVSRVWHAGQRRRQLASQAVSTYLDLVVLCLAGGMGVEGALDAAATVAEDPFSARIAAVLDGARHGGRPPWQALAAMGTDLGVSELVEVANTVSLAGTEGARIRATLAAKAETLRRRQLAKTESEANAMTERLFLPGALLLIGFLVFIGYPAFARILSGL